MSKMFSVGSHHKAPHNNNNAKWLHKGYNLTMLYKTTKQYNIVNKMN